jgi:hypothetical protein
MNMYLGYFEAEENTEGDNPPMGPRPLAVYWLT